jgi:cysteinyl-tRNA synthetase
MSKSLGNFFTLRDLIEKGYTGREIRFVLISSQYRQPLNFTFDALVGARSAIARIDEFVSMLKDKAGAAAAGTAPAWAVEAEEQFGKALDDDLNMPEALAAVFTLISSGNKQAAAMTAEGAAAVLQIMNKIDMVINLVNKEEVAIPDEVTKLLEERAEARKNKQWADSDRIRDALAAMGWAVKDTKEGQTVSPLAK